MAVVQGGKGEAMKLTTGQKKLPKALQDALLKKNKKAKTSSKKKKK